MLFYIGILTATSCIVVGLYLWGIICRCIRTKRRRECRGGGV